MTPADVVDALREVVQPDGWTVERSTTVNDFVREEVRLDVRLTRSANVQMTLDEAASASGDEDD